MKNHILLYHIQTPQISQINTSCNVNSKDKSYSSSYSKVFSKSIAKDKTYCSFETEDPLPFEGGIFFLMDEQIAHVFTQVNVVLLHIGKRHHT